MQFFRGSIPKATWACLFISTVPVCWNFQEKTRYSCGRRITDICAVFHHGAGNGKTPKYNPFDNDLQDTDNQDQIGVLWFYVFLESEIKIHRKSLVEFRYKKFFFKSKSRSRERYCNTPSFIGKLPIVYDAPFPSHGETPRSRPEAGVAAERSATACLILMPVLQSPSKFVDGVINF